MSERADLVFVGGRVHTVNATDEVVDAVAVRGGGILVVGGDAEVRALAGHGTRVVELRGRSLLPDASLFGIEQALTRRTMDGDVCGPAERVNLDTAIRMHTINGAYAAFEEDVKGSLEPGKLADLVVLAEDLAGVPAERIRGVGVAMTVVGGRVVYEG